MPQEPRQLAWQLRVAGRSLALTSSPPSTRRGSGWPSSRRSVLNAWAIAHGLPPGEIAFDHADPGTSAQLAVLDLVWREGFQPGLTEPVAVLLDESAEALSLASVSGFRCFTASQQFRRYVETGILNLEAA